MNLLLLSSLKLDLFPIKNPFMIFQNHLVIIRVILMQTLIIVSNLLP